MPKSFNAFSRDKLSSDIVHFQKAFVTGAISQRFGE
jgi:hypothetical protein